MSGIGWLILLLIFVVACYSPKVQTKITAEFYARKLHNVGAYMTHEGRVTLEYDTAYFEEKLDGRWVTVRKNVMDDYVNKDDKVFRWKSGKYSYKLDLRDYYLTVVDLDNGKTITTYSLKKYYVKQ